MERLEVGCVCRDKIVCMFQPWEGRMGGMERSVMCLQEGQVDLGRKMEKFSGRVVILEGVLQHLSGVREDGGDVQASLVAISQAFQALQVEVDKLREGGGSWDGRLACLEREGEVGCERLGHLGSAMVAMTEEVKKLDKGYEAMRGGWLETNRLVSGLRVGQLQLEAARPRVGLPFPRPSGGPDAPPVEGGLHPGLVSGREEVLSTQ